MIQLTFLIIFSLSACITAILTTLLSKKFSQKYLLLSSEILFLVGSIETFLAIALKSIGILYTTLIVNGIAAGITMTVLPSYLIEIATLKNRGSFGAFVYIGKSFERRFS